MNTSEVNDRVTLAAQKIVKNEGDNAVRLVARSMNRASAPSPEKGLDEDELRRLVSKISTNVAAGITDPIQGSVTREFTSAIQMIRRMMAGAGVSDSKTMTNAIDENEIKAFIAKIARATVIEIVDEQLVEYIRGL